MDIKTLQKDMIAAMKNKDKPRKESISALIQAVKKMAIDEGCRDDIPTEMVDKVILKEMKTVKMSTLYELRLLFAQGEKEEYSKQEIVELLDKIATAKEQE